MGTVWLAEEDGERLALKAMHPHLVRWTGYYQRFQREAQAGARVDHPNVVRTLGSELLMQGDLPWYLMRMEYVEGRTLRALQCELGTVPEGLLRAIAQQVTAGLAAIHAEALLHRDIKPDNVLITSDHVVRVMDHCLLSCARPVPLPVDPGQRGVHHEDPDHPLRRLAGPRRDSPGGLRRLGHHASFARR